MLHPPLDIACQSSADGLCDVDVPFAGMTFGLRGLLEVARQGLRSTATGEDDCDLRCGSVVVHLPQNACREQIARAVPSSAASSYVSVNRRHGQVLGLSVHVWFD